SASERPDGGDCVAPHFYRGRWSRSEATALSTRRARHEDLAVSGGPPGGDLGATPGDARFPPRRPASPLRREGAARLGVVYDARRSGQSERAQRVSHASRLRRKAATAAKAERELLVRVPANGAERAAKSERSAVNPGQSERAQRVSHASRLRRKAATAAKAERELLVRVPANGAERAAKSERSAVNP